jgi:hypothetical protein
MFRLMGFVLLSIYGRSFYLVCPDVLSLVGELLSADGCGLPNHVQFWLFSYDLFIYSFIYS